MNIFLYLDFITSSKVVIIEFYRLKNFLRGKILHIFFRTHNRFKDIQCHLHELSFMIEMTNCSCDSITYSIAML